MNGRVILAAAVLWAAGSTQIIAACQGKDLFQRLETEVPALHAAIEAKGRAFPFAQGKLFRLTNAEGKQSYIFGTLHLTDPRVTRLSPKLRGLLAQARLVALETIEDGASPRSAIGKDRARQKAALLASPARRADRLLGPEDFFLLEKRLGQRGLSRRDAKKLKATVLALFLDLPLCAIARKESPPYADEGIAGLARADGIPVAGLETLTEQITILDGMSRENERDLLGAMLRQDAHSEDLVETMIARYEVGDLGIMLAWMRSAEPEAANGLATVPRAFWDRLIVARNRRMRERALPLLEKGNVFIAVGAAHLPGEDGLLRLLEAKGFRIEMIE